MKHLINQLGNIDDIKCSLRNSSKYTLADMEAALENENSKEKPRQTVIKLLETNINRKRREVQP